MVTAEKSPPDTVTVTVHPVPPPVDVVAVAVYVPFVYPDPVPVTASAVISPNALVAVELLFCITFCLIRNLPASKFPLNNAVPVAVSTVTTSDVPSVILNDLSVPPLNTKSPPPLVSKFSGISIFVPTDFHVFALANDN